MAQPIEIPGFTYDAVKNRYFKAGPLTQINAPPKATVDERDERIRTRRGQSWYKMLEKRRLTGHLDVRGVWEGVAQNLFSDSIDCGVSSNPDNGHIVVNRSGTLLAHSKVAFDKVNISRVKCYNIKATHSGVQADLIPSEYNDCVSIGPFGHLPDGRDVLYITLYINGGFLLTQRIFCRNGCIKDRHSFKVADEEDLHRGPVPLLVSLGYKDSLIVAYHKYGINFFKQFHVFMRTEEIEMRRRHSRRVSAIDMDKESPLVAIGYNDGEVCIIDTRSPLRPKFLGHVPGVEKRISRVVKVHLLSGGTHIITSTMNSKLQLWDVRMSHVVHSFSSFSNSHSRHLPSVLDDREAFIAAGCDDSVVRLWSVSSGELLSSVPAKPNSAVCFSDNLGGVTGKPSLLVEDGNKIIAYPCSPFGPPTNKWSILQDF